MLSQDRRSREFPELLSNQVPYTPGLLNPVGNLGDKVGDGGRGKRHISAEHIVQASFAVEKAMTNRSLKPRGSREEIGAVRLTNTILVGFPASG
jgi:hypothetical protein